MFKLTLGLTFDEKEFGVRIVHIEWAIQAVAAQVAHLGGPGHDPLAAHAVVRSFSNFACGILNLRSWANINTILIQL